MYSQSIRLDQLCYFSEINSERIDYLFEEAKTVDLDFEWNYKLSLKNEHFHLKKGFYYLLMTFFLTSISFFIPINLFVVYLVSLFLCILATEQMFLSNCYTKKTREAINLFETVSNKIYKEIGSLIRDNDRIIEEMREILEGWPENEK
jgi:hypothetical protein